MEERVKHLEQTVERMDANLLQTKLLIAEEAAERRDAIDGEKSAREASDADTRKLLEEQVVGGLHLETMGAGWIALGIFLATGSAELSKLLKAAL